MFGSRRHRAPNPPLTAATANPNAATAAATVFKRHESNPSLSAAAAAAALRARPTTPTRVAHVQTKRTLRRSASVASTGTASENARDQPGLRRRGSSGSMTERTFRTPSPHRPGSNGSGDRRNQSFTDDTPPVPALPKNMSTPPRQPSRGAQREPQNWAASDLGTGTKTVRVASQKLASGGAPSWFGAAKLGDIGTVRRTDPAMASPPSSPLQAPAREEELSEGARPSSQASSFNFSYPTGTRRGSANLPKVTEPNSPIQIPGHASQPLPCIEKRQSGQALRAQQQQRGKPVALPARQPSGSSISDQALVYDPNSRRMVRQADLIAVQQASLDASQQTTDLKKNRAPHRAGSHLAAGTMGRTKTDVPHTAPVAMTQPARAADRAQLERQVQPPPPTEAAPVHATRLDSEEPAVKAIIRSPRIEAKKLEQQRSQNAMEQGQISVPAIPTPTPPVLDTTRFAVRRQPSVVQEEPEPENPAEEEKPQRMIDDVLDAVPGRRKMPSEATPESQLLELSRRKNPAESFTTGRTDRRPNTCVFDVSGDGASKPSATDHGRTAQASSERNHSSSPARQAHFGPVQNLTVKHSPPPRSISPRKSAMKHVSPPRGTSPSTSEASGSVNQDLPVVRKKSVRVSFDDCGTRAAGQPASTNRNDPPSATSPLHANPGRSKDLSSLDDEVVMKPRPALPSFGSVRDRKPRDNNSDQPERPLVRPRGETRFSSPLLPSPPLGSSNDHVIGAVLSNPRREFKEKSDYPEDNWRQRAPLPPIVTSVEGSGYFSDSSDSSSIISSDFGQREAPLPTTAPEPGPETKASLESATPNAPINGSGATTGQEALPSRVISKQDRPQKPEIPTISISQGMPLGVEDKSLGQYVMGVPGGFPDDESDQSAASGVKRLRQAVAAATPAETTQKDHVTGQAATRASEPTTAETSSDSEGSIYSDAYEDLSEIETGGFQSLDAVVKNPLQPGLRPTAQHDQVASVAPTQKPAEEGPKLKTEISLATAAVETPSTERTEDEWERAKAYLRSLTAEKRAQLEREAREEAGIEADREDAKPETKRKKKPVGWQNSERQALAVHMAQQKMAQQDQEKAAGPDRSYMIKPGERWAVDDSDITQMRKTMRCEPQFQEQATAALTARSRLLRSLRASNSGARTDVRPVSSHIASAPRETGGHRRSATQVDLVFEATTVQRPLVRRGSTGSESSFKRSRPATAQSLTFRQSLRQTSTPSAQGDSHTSKRFSLRTLSPTASAPRQSTEVQLGSAPAHTQLRTTLRGPSTGRKNPTGMRMPSFSLSYGGGKKSGSSGKTPGSKSAGPRFSSRFADSSDEEDGEGGIPSGFHSRFEDSSDDEPVMPMPIPLPKTTSAPYAASAAAGSLKKESSIASTALPEELEESEGAQDAQQATMATATEPVSTKPAAVHTTALRRTRSGRGQLLGLQTAPSPTNQAAAADMNNKRRSSIMSVLRHRKSKGKGREDGSAAAANFSGKISRPEVSESAARRDTRLERSVGQLERIRSRGSSDTDGEDEGGETPTPVQQSPRSPRSPRLQKRRSKKTASAPAATVFVTPLSVASTADEAGGHGVLAPEAEQHANGVRAGRAFQQLLLPRRSTASGNLGTRTLSGGGFLHLHSQPRPQPQPQPQRRALSMSGLEATASLEGSVAGASSTRRRKRFGALRRMFGLDE